MYVIDDVHYFSNLTDFINEVKKAETIKGRDKDSMSSDIDFTGTRDIDEAWDKLERGDYGDVGKDILSNLDKLNLRSNKSTQYNDVVGFVPNVPNYLMGVPKTMVNREVQIFQNKVVNVLINSSVNGGISRSEIVNTSVKILEAILKFERDGYRVNIYKMIGSSIDGGSKGVLGFIKIKDDKERINLKKLMFPLTHPSMQRRLDFRFRECFGKVDVTHDGYGSQRWWNKQFVAKYFKRLCNGDFLYANVHDFDEHWYEKLNTEKGK